MQEYKGIVIFGETGTGKSTIQNVLTGQQNIFNVSHSMKSKTKKCQQKSGNLFGDISKPQIQVIDTPGFQDSSGSDDDTIKNIYEMLVSLKDQGFNIILYCISATNVRCTKAIIDGFKLLQSLLGNEVLARIFIVVTQLNKLQDQDQKLKCDQISNQLPEVLESAGIGINKDQILYYFHNQKPNGLEKLEQLLSQSQTFFPKILQVLKNCFDPDDSYKTLNKLMMNSREMQNLQLRIEQEKQQKILYEQQQQEKQRKLKQALQSDKQTNLQLMEQMKRDHENQKQQLKNHHQIYNDIQDLLFEKNCQYQDFDSVNQNNQLQHRKQYDVSLPKTKQQPIQPQQNCQYPNYSDDYINKMRQLIEYLYETRPRGWVSQMFCKYNQEKHDKLINYGIKVVAQQMQNVQEDEKRLKKEFIEYLYDTKPWIFQRDKHNDFIKFFVQGY